MKTENTSADLNNKLKMQRQCRTKSRSQRHQDRRTDQFSSSSSKKYSNSEKDDPKTSVCPDVVVNEQYEKAWALFISHTVTNNIKNNKTSFLFSGSSSDAEKLNALKSIGVNGDGMYVSQQEAIESSWKNESIKSFRAIVLEQDTGASLDNQIKLILDSKIPYSCMVHSGGKSVHVWIKFDSSVDEKKMRYFREILMILFPTADKKPLSLLNGLCRFPLESERYNQRLLDFKGLVNLEEFERWIEENLTKYEQEKLKESEQKAEFHSKVKSHRQTQPSRSGRHKCPICARRNPQVEYTLKIMESSDGKLIFYCFRCSGNTFSRLLLENYFLKKQDRDSNLVLKMLLIEIEKRILHSDNCWYRIEQSTKLLSPVDEGMLRKELWKPFHQVCEEVNSKASEFNFRDAVNTLARTLDQPVAEVPRGSICTMDGYYVDIRDTSKLKKNKAYITNWLPIRVRDLQKPITTPLWEQTLELHTSGESKEILEAFIGYILSGVQVRTQECMLILHGPSDTGKSTLLDFLAYLLGEKAVRLSIGDALEHPIQASNLLGKRLAIASEAAVMPRNAERFRAAISGEKVRVKLLYKGELDVQHNCVFVAATNDSGWISKAPENKKRIRVVNWVNPIEEKDFYFIEKLKREAPGIIARCLKAYSKYINVRIPQGKDTEDYLTIANRNVNHVADWLFERGIEPGKFFVSTQFLQTQFNYETAERMSLSEFGRKIKAALGTVGVKRDDIRGVLLSMDKAEIEGKSR